LTGLVAQRDTLITSLGDLSSTLATLTPNATASISFNRETFSALPDVSGLSVFSLNAADLDTFGEIKFHRNGADTVIVTSAARISA